jgi:crotonyl-CoA carboxylase/reductase
VFAWENIQLAHQMMRKNQHKPGNMAVLVAVPCAGLRNFEDVLEAADGG